MKTEFDVLAAIVQQEMPSRKAISIVAGCSEKRVREAIEQLRCELGVVISKVPAAEATLWKSASFYAVTEWGSFVRESTLLEMLKERSLPGLKEWERESHLNLSTRSAHTALATAAAKHSSRFEIHRRSYEKVKLKNYAESQRLEGVVSTVNFRKPPRSEEELKAARALLIERYKKGTANAG